MRTCSDTDLAQFAVEEQGPEGVGSSLDPLFDLEQRHPARSVPAVQWHKQQILVEAGNCLLEAHMEVDRPEVESHKGQREDCMRFALDGKYFRRHTVPHRYLGGCQ